ncbi:3,4-dihydroxy-2-butanone-4-phosphate synthase [Rothia sp. ZJ1223]|uniref:3,4-dihydroxy-2-butanone-4-phosphate synthase n=1 Tax=Rothia sp. ZJ1223 TaxID=2811098 RepID=UPI00195A4AFE|nr:3,4-dihydroxy-2-butanone-4-phosphate synthase [Rothia sp. ZJ1223]MBM7050672.1 3,4-dihydroxy-2-butanone-4-phosphate synthase [Rothia sp. ZJ1223]
MFTGIIGAVGTVERLEPVFNAAGDVESAVLTINAGSIIDDLEHGGSLAVNGVCLTATRTQELGKGRFAADVMGETLRCTNLGTVKVSDRVNLERCMPVGGRFDGHIVQGHVDGVGTVALVEDHDSWRTVRVSVPAHIAPHLSEKGSIAISGTSLTVTAVSPADATEHWFEVGLIPATLEATTLGQLKTGDTVNLETDALAKYVQRMLEVSAVQGTRILSTHQEEQPAASERTERATASLDSVTGALEAIKAGGAVIVVDNENRENEGDIIFAAEHATPELLAFTVRYTTGVICVPMPGERADALLLPPMTAVNEDLKNTAYTVSCDARYGISTGVSAADRALTARLLADANAQPADLTRPGHMFPLRAVDGGVRERDGHTEAAVELTRLAGLSGVGVIAELVHDSGEMMRFDALRAFATEHGLPMISIEQLIAAVSEDAR